MEKWSKKGLYNHDRKYKLHQCGKIKLTSIRLTCHLTGADKFASGKVGVVRGDGRIDDNQHVGNASVHQVNLVETRRVDQL